MRLRVVKHKMNAVKSYCAMNEKIYEYDTVIQSSVIGSGGAYVPFPYDVRAD